ncbi:MAG: ABC transporter substrate-binding protein [Bacteriovoracaceae bacterium]
MKNKMTSVICLILFSKLAFSSSLPIVGYGSSDAVLNAKNQELFLMGFQAGFQSNLRKSDIKDLLIIDQVSDGSQLGSMKVAERLLSKGVSLIAGFPTSHEALLAGSVARKFGVLSIFSGAGHSDLGKMGPTVFTTGESMELAVETMLKFIRKKFPNKTGMLISNPYAVFSKNQEDVTIQKIRQKINQDIILYPAHLSKSLTLSQQDILKIKKKEISYLVITPYADESARLLEQLQKNEIDLPIITNSSWTTGDLDFGRRFMVSLKSPTYCQALWMKGSKDSIPFERLIQKKYGRPATSEIANGYDLGVIVAKVLNGITGPITKESVLNSFKLQKCFSGLSTGRMCFNPNGGHAEKKINFVRFTKEGFVPVEFK